MAVSLIIADDHPMMLMALRMLFTQPDFTILAETRDRTATVEAVLAHNPDVLILDIQMSGVGGTEALRQLHAHGIRTRTVVFTAALDDQCVFDALRLGAMGFVLKSVVVEELVESVRTVAEGRTWISPDVFRRALKHVSPKPADAEILTPRERELIRFVGAGLRNKEIARAMTITEGTVKMHLHNIFGKLGTSNRTGLAVLAKEKQIC